MTRKSQSPFAPPTFLHLEDSPADAELIQAELTREWPDCRIQRVQTRQDFVAALENGGVDLILSDFSMPGFDGLSALAIASENRPDIPFIFLSGTIGEENAVEALKRGATDYVIKDRMGRLVSSIRRALDEVHGSRRRRQAEKKLREQAALLDKAQDAIYVRDLEGRILYWNRSAERIYGYSTADALGRSSPDLLLHGADSAAFLEAQQALMERGEWVGELRKINKAGQELDIMARWTLVRDESGLPANILCIETDVTERKRLEKQFFRAQRLESLGTLAGGIAHDLNNALAPILMAIELMEAKATDNDTRRMLEVLATSAKHGAALVRQILAFARGAEGGRSELQPRLIIREAARLLGETLPRSIEIQEQVPDDLACVVGDSTQFHQVLINLCVNARDAMPDGGRLTLRAENVTVDRAMVRNNPGAKRGPHVLITVADSGTGIPPEILDRIFDPFFTTKEAGKGTGLGLATVLGIVKGHGGFLQVHSRPGRGTEFRLFFPAATAASSADKPLAGIETPLGRGETVLVIDDELSVRAIAGALLEAHGYHAIVAEDGPAGVDLYRERAAEIDLVLTDMMMPGMQGAQVIAALRGINPDVCIVAMSGLVEAQRLGTTPVAGRLEFLQKPMTGVEMLRVVQQMLAKRPSR